MMSRADKLIVVFALFGVAWLYGLFWQGGGEADQVRISSGREAPRLLSLAADQTLHVHGPLGESVIEVKDGAARFVSSPCPGKFCIKTGWLREAGDLAACLPNGVTVQLLGGKSFDAINF